MNLGRPTALAADTATMITLGGVMKARAQGLTLVRFSAQRKHCLSDTLGTLNG